MEEKFLRQLIIDVSFSKLCAKTRAVAAPPDFVNIDNLQASDRSLEVWKAPRKIKQLKETLYEKVVKSSLFHEILYA